MIPTLQTRLKVTRAVVEVAVRITTLLSLLLLLFGPLPGQITNHQLNAPTRLEVNLGPTPIDQYDSTNCLPGYTDCSTNLQHRYIAACGAPPIVVRQCYQTALQSYHFSEHVTGVRFDFAFCGGYYSTPLLGCGGTVSLSTTWPNKLNEFFTDVYNAGITYVTPRPVFQGFGGDAGYKDQCASGCAVNGWNDPCGVGTTHVEWWPASPFSYNYQGGGVPYGDTSAHLNTAYTCSPANTVNFVGWSNIYSVINSVAQKASANHLTIEEVDVYGEIQLAKATVYGRFIVDNTHNNEAVLTGIRNQVGSASGGVTYSTQDGGGSSVANHECGSVYGDSARILLTSELAGAIGGGKFGWPGGPPDTTSDPNLVCGGTITGMIGLPISFTEPSIVDLHAGPCVVVSGGGCVPFNSQTGTPSQNTEATEAQDDFTDVKTFLDSFCPSGWRHNSTQLCNAYFMLGEVPVYQPNTAGGNANANCDGSPIVVPAGAVQGFNASTLSGRSISGQAGVIFRPYVDPTGVHAPTTSAYCYGFPQALQPTFLPNP